MIGTELPVDQSQQAEPEAQRQPKWTVMIFMGADSVEGNEPLDQAVTDDLAEIQCIGGSSTLEVFVEVHRHVGPTSRHRYFWDADRKRKAEHHDLDVAIPDRGRALIDFIDYSVGTSRHRRDDHSMLVLWGHAYDFAFGRYRTRGGVLDAIDFVELSGMLARLQDIMRERYRHLYGDPDQSRPTLDIVGFDACDAATVELACQLQPFAKYLLGSEIGIPLPGWPYDRVLGRLAKPEGRLMGPAEFGSWAVRRFCESYPSSSPVSLTFLDLAQAGELRQRAELLALALSATIAPLETRRHIAEIFLRSQTGDGRPYVDVADLCLTLVRECDDPLVEETARRLGDLLLNPRPPLVGTSVVGTGRPLIVDHGRNAGELARLNGISLYAPHVAANDFAAVRSVYDQFVFAKETVSSGLVHMLAQEF